jgi:chlorophyllide a reductase subunit Y
MNDDAAQINVSAAKSDGLGCHAGKDEMRRAAATAGKSETLERYARDYPAGPHDQPQSMCPAFGSLRVGLRMRRTATVLSGSACCVYGLTFTSHFYGARRTVGYVPFNSETLVTGKLFEDIRESVFKLADPALYDAVVIINLCVPTASGVPLQLLPREISRVSACPPTRRRRMCSPARCSSTPAPRPRKGPYRRRAADAMRSPRWP